MTDPEPAARLRAAFAYARLDRSARAEVLGVSVRQLTRIEGAEAPVPADKWEAVAAATGVPMWFFRTGFEAAPLPEDPTLAERVEALEHRLEVVTRLTPEDLDGLREVVDRLRQEGNRDAGRGSR